MKQWLLIFLFLLLAGCASTGSEESMEDLLLMDDWLDRAIIKRPHTAESIKGIGHLIDEVSEPCFSLHGGNEWRYTTYRFDGMTIGAMVSCETLVDRALIYSIVIDGPEWVLSDGLSVGQPVSNIELPVTPINNRLEFCGVASCVVFDEKQGLISRIEFNLYVD